MLIVFTLLCFLLIPMLDNIYVNALAIERNVTFPESMNDMQITEEQYNDLNGIFDYDEDLNSFRLKDDWFVWPKGIIPYQFDDVRTLDQVDKNRVIAAMEKINFNLPSCILFRYKNIGKRLFSDKLSASKNINNHGKCR